MCSLLFGLEILSLDIIICAHKWHKSEFLYRGHAQYDVAQVENRNLVNMKPDNLRAKNVENICTYRF